MLTKVNICLPMSTYVYPMFTPMITASGWGNLKPLILLDVGRCR